MSETAPYLVESIGREGYIPFYARWSDGSEYRCVQEQDHYVRSFHGPMFGLKLGDWKFVTWDIAK